MEQGQKNIILVGFMGAGKTAVGRVLSQRLGMAFLDTDHLITLLAGAEPGMLIAERGEKSFREVESEAVRRVSELHHTVIATGGGALLSDANRMMLRESGQLVWLRASPEVLRSRVGLGEGRPLWSDEPERLLAAREPLYQMADLIIDTDDIGIEQVAALVVERLGLCEPGPGPGPRRRELVPGSSAVIGSGFLPAVDEILGTAEGRSVVVAADPVVSALYGQDIAAGLETSGLSVHRTLLTEGEDGKNWDRAGRLIEEWSADGLNRDDLVVAVGGGATTDVVGFAASCYMRGVSVAYVVTTLLGAVDAAIGGKTGVNAAGVKNLAGTFHQPRLVVIDTWALGSLPEREWRSGLGELLKYGVGLDRGMYDQIVEDADRIRSRDPRVITELVERAVEQKAGICRQDERERGKRALLNLGHTGGHALEASPELSLTHGEAVGLGMVVAARISERLGLASEPVVPAVMTALERLGLPTGVVGNRPRAGELERRLGLDKKRRAGELRMVLPTAVGTTAVVPVAVGLVSEELARLWT